MNFFILSKKKFDFSPTSIFYGFNSPKMKVEMISSEIAEETKEKLPEQKLEETIKAENFLWKISIPCILLDAPIADGTDDKTMNEFVGHFSETDKIQGNVGLAAHNRGYQVNYFENLKKLKEGDEIFYQYKNQKRTYLVEKNKIIKDTDWHYLEKTEENQITLITCVENEPQYRRCIVAKEKRKEKKIKD